MAHIKKTCAKNLSWSTLTHFLIKVQLRQMAPSGVHSLKITKKPYQLPWIFTNTTSLTRYFAQISQKIKPCRTHAHTHIRQHNHRPSHAGLCAHYISLQFWNRDRICHRRICCFQPGHVCPLFFSSPATVQRMRHRISYEWKLHNRDCHDKFSVILMMAIAKIFGFLQKKNIATFAFISSVNICKTTSTYMQRRLQCQTVVLWRFWNRNRGFNPKPNRNQNFQILQAN